MAQSSILQPLITITMSNQNGREPNAAPADDVGDLFDYDVPSLDEILSKAPAQTTTSFQKPSSGDNSGLGLDEEVKVTKTRAPVAKLDENRYLTHPTVYAYSANQSRLLSQPGIPKLRRAAKSKLRFKGKGHEVWLDEE